MSASAFTVLPFAPQYAPAWKALNEGWIIEAGFALESKDHRVLNKPETEVLAKGGHILFVIDQDGTALGCGSLMPIEGHGFEVAKMAVTPSARGQGLSRLILQALEDKARKSGADRLYIETNSALAPALRLYESFGFTYLPTQTTPYARADIFMEKRL